MELNEEVKIVESSVAVTERVKIKVKGGAIYAFFKRAFDIFASLIAIIVLLIPMLIVAFIVWATSKGPALYVSERVGENGRVFKFLKFRTMVHNAEEQLEELLKQNEVEGGVTFKM